MRSIDQPGRELVTPVQNTDPEEPSSKPPTLVYSSIQLLLLLDQDRIVYLSDTVPVTDNGCLIYVIVSDTVSVWRLDVLSKHLTILFNFRRHSKITAEQCYSENLDSSRLSSWRLKFNRIVRCWDKTSSHHTETVLNLILIKLLKFY